MEETRLDACAGRVNARALEMDCDAENMGAVHCRRGFCDVGNMGASACFTRERRALQDMKTAGSMADFSRMA